MVLGQILKIGSVIFRHRKAIYSVLTAQDRYISKSLKYGGFGKASSLGWRSGAAGGGLIGPFISDNIAELGNGFSPIQQESPSGNQYKKRTRNFRYSRSRSQNYSTGTNYNRRQRYTCRPKFRRKR